jgi:hypothetical protein
LPQVKAKTHTTKQGEQDTNTVCESDGKVEEKDGESDRHDLFAA